MGLMNRLGSNSLQEPVTASGKAVLRHAAAGRPSSMAGRVVRLRIEARRAGGGSLGRQGKDSLILGPNGGTPGRGGGSQPGGPRLIFPGQKQGAPGKLIVNDPEQAAASAQKFRPPQGFMDDEGEWHGCAWQSLFQVSWKHAILHTTHSARMIFQTLSLASWKQTSSSASWKQFDSLCGIMGHQSCVERLRAREASGWHVV